MLGRYQDPAWAKRGDGTCLLPETMYIVHLGWLDNDARPSASLPRDKPEVILTAAVCVACGSAAPGARPRQHWWSQIGMIGVKHRLRELQGSGSTVGVARIRDAEVVRSCCCEMRRTQSSNDIGSLRYMDLLPCRVIADPKLRVLWVSYNSLEIGGPAR